MYHFFVIQISYNAFSLNSFQTQICASVIRWEMYCSLLQMEVIFAGATELATRFPLIAFVVFLALSRSQLRLCLDNSRVRVSERREVACTRLCQNKCTYEWVQNTENTYQSQRAVKTDIGLDGRHRHLLPLLAVSCNTGAAIAAGFEQPPRTMPRPPHRHGKCIFHALFMFVGR